MIFERRTTDLGQGIKTSNTSNCLTLRQSLSVQTKVKYLSVYLSLLSNASGSFALKKVQGGCFTIVIISSVYYSEEENLDVLRDARKVIDTSRPRIVIACTLDKIPYPSESYVRTREQKIKNSSSGVLQ
jgi:hypothetical protein